MSQHTQFEEEFHDGPQVPYQVNYTPRPSPYPAANYPGNASALYPPAQAGRVASSSGRLALAILSLLLIFVMFVGALLVIASSHYSALAGFLGCVCALAFSVVVLSINLIFRRR